jgi:hypothetical protein
VSFWDLCVLKCRQLVHFNLGRKAFLTALPLCDSSICHLLIRLEPLMEISIILWLDVCIQSLGFLGQGVMSSSLL